MRYASLVALCLAASCARERGPVESPETPAPEVAPPLAPEPTQPPAEEPQPVPLSAKVVARFDPSPTTPLVDLHEVALDLLVRGAPEGAELTVELFAPGELPYEVRKATLEPVPGAPQSARIEVPVAGTMVAANQLAGRWEARVFLADVPVTTYSFELTP